MVALINTRQGKQGNDDDEEEPAFVTSTTLAHVSSVPWGCYERFQYMTKKIPGGETTPTADGCAKKCSMNHGCKSFTWLVSGCYLLSTTPLGGDYMPCEDCLSGVPWGQSGVPLISKRCIAGSRL